MSLPSDYFESYGGAVTSLEAFVKAVRQISAFQLRTGSRFVWRGVAQANWPLYSSLVRAFEQAQGRLPTEQELRGAEIAIIREAVRGWGLDWHAAGGRLTGLELSRLVQALGGERLLPQPHGVEGLLPAILLDKPPLPGSKAPS